MASAQKLRSSQVFWLVTVGFVVVLNMFGLLVCLAYLSTGIHNATSLNVETSAPLKDVPSTTYGSIPSPVVLTGTEDDPHNPTVTITIFQPSTTEDKMTLGFSIDLSSMERNLRVVRNGRPRHITREQLSATGDPFILRIDNTPSHTVSIKFAPSEVFARNSLSTMYPPGTFSQYPRENTMHSAVFKMIGSPRYFPFDRYVADFTDVYLDAPDDLVVFNGKSFEPLQVQHLTVQFVRDGDFTEQHLQAAFLSENTNFGIMISRPGFAITYIILLALVPVFLALLMATFLFGRGKQVSASIEALVGVTASVLAVLPLRAVLVPGTVSTITLLDALLGAGILFTVLVFAIERFQSLWKERQTGP